MATGIVDNGHVNMLISDLANTEKLVGERERYHYGDKEPEKLGSCLEEDDITIPQHNFVPPTHNGPAVEQVDEVPKDDAQPVQKDEPKPEVDEYDSATPAKQKMMKLDILRKLVELAKKGVTLTQNYTMESDYKVMKYEYELHENFRNKHIGVKLMQDFCSFTVHGLEYANKSYDPFGLKLDGWSDAVNSEPEQLLDVFGGLYDKYGGVGGSSPEMRLIQILTFSAFKVHMAHATMASTPDLRQMVQQNPVLVAQLRPQAIGTRMAEQATGQETKYSEKEEQQYQKVLEQARDYQVLMTQEEENRRNQQQPVMRPPTMRRQTPTPPQTRSPHQPISMEQIQVEREISPEQYDQFVSKNMTEHQEHLKRMHKQEQFETSSKYETASQHSSVKRNTNMDELLRDAEQEIASQATTGSKKHSKKRKSKKSTLVLDM